MHPVLTGDRRSRSGKRADCGWGGGQSYRRRRRGWCGCGRVILLGIAIGRHRPRGVSLRGKPGQNVNSEEVHTHRSELFHVLLQQLMRRRTLLNNNQARKMRKTSKPERQP